MNRTPQRPDRRRASRMPCHARFAIHDTTWAVEASTHRGGPLSDAWIDRQVEVIDVSSFGAQIVAPRGRDLPEQLHLVWGGVSIRALVARRGDPTRWGRRWGVLFESSDGEAWVPSPACAERAALLMSENPLELIWWFIRLPPECDEVFVAGPDVATLGHLRRLDPTRVVRRAETPAA